MLIALFFSGGKCVSQSSSACRKGVHRCRVSAVVAASVLCLCRSSPPERDPQSVLGDPGTQSILQEAANKGSMSSWHECDRRALADKQHLIAALSSPRRFVRQAGEKRLQASNSKSFISCSFKPGSTSW